jgi:hypothetical protein
MSQAVLGLLSKYLSDEKFSREFFIISVVSSHQSAFLTHSNQAFLTSVISLFCGFHRRYFPVSSLLLLSKSPRRAL